MKGARQKELPKKKKKRNIQSVQFIICEVKTIKLTKRTSSAEEVKREERNKKKYIINSQIDLQLLKRNIDFINY